MWGEMVVENFVTQRPLPLVGRDRELEIVLSQFEACQTGQLRVVMLAGEPGIGKSTLLLQAAANFANAIGPVLYASGEESEHQIKARGDRLGVGDAPLYLLAETCIERILEEIGRVKPALMIELSCGRRVALLVPVAVL